MTSESHIIHSACAILYDDRSHIFSNSHLEGRCCDNNYQNLAKTRNWQTRWNNFGHKFKKNKGKLWA